MDKQALKEHLKTLTELTGPPAFESAVRDYVRATWTGLVDEFQVNGLGNLIGIKRGTGPEPRKRIMLSAHMDEIGMMVTEINNGYLRVTSMGGFDFRLMLAKPVLVHTRTRTLHGTVAAIPPHISQYTGGTDAYPTQHDLWIDLGLSADEVADLVEVGNIITMDAPFIEMGDKVVGKAMDDRASVASVTACLHYLQSRVHQWDVYAVASTQEEVGLRGATTAAYSVAPDVAIAIDTTFAQQPGVSGDDNPKLGDGPTLGIGPNFHTGLFKSLQEAASRLEITLPIEPTPGNSGTDAWAIQVSHQGVPTALLSIPIRNMHTPIETTTLKDIDRTARLMAEFISGMDATYLDTIQWQKPNATNGGEA